MGWLLVLLLFAVGVPVFFRIYRRHLDRLSGPWIANQASQND
jgi:hypothetical protein